MIGSKPAMRKGDACASPSASSSSSSAPSAASKAPRPPRALEFFRLRIVERTYNEGIPQARVVKATETYLDNLRDPATLGPVARDHERDVVIEHAEILPDGTLWIAASARSPMSRSVLLAYVVGTCAHFGEDKEVTLEQLPPRL